MPEDVPEQVFMVIEVLRHEKHIEQKEHEPPLDKRVFDLFDGVVRASIFDGKRVVHDELIPGKSCTP